MDVSYPGTVVYKDVVKKQKCKVPQVWLKYFIHQCLEGRESIGQTKTHNKEFKIVMMGAKCCLLRICLVHSHLVKAKPQVQFGKVFGRKQFITEFVNHRNGKFVFDGFGTQSRLSTRSRQVSLDFGTNSTGDENGD